MMESGLPEYAPISIAGKLGTGKNLTPYWRGCIMRKVL
jgi:hypothetical protein